MSTAAAMKGESVRLYERDGSEIETVQIQSDEIFNKFKERILCEIGVNLNEFHIIFVRKMPDQVAEESEDSTTLTADDFGVSELAVSLSDFPAAPNSSSNTQKNAVVYPTVPPARKVNIKRERSEMAQENDSNIEGESHSISFSDNSQSFNQCHYQ